MAVVRPVVECNRTQVDNGRTYLREIVFGDPAEPYHHEALALTVQTEEAVAAVLRRDERTTAQDPAALAHIVSAIMFISMAARINAANPVDGRGPGDQGPGKGAPGPVTPPGDRPRAPTVMARAYG
jgi:hypothetical protein